MKRQIPCAGLIATTILGNAVPAFASENFINSAALTPAMLSSAVSGNTINVMQANIQPAVGTGGGNVLRNVNNTNGVLSIVQNSGGGNVRQSIIVEIGNTTATPPTTH